MFSRKRKGHDHSRGGIASSISSTAKISIDAEMTVPVKRSPGNDTNDEKNLHEYHRQEKDKRGPQLMCTNVPLVRLLPLVGFLILLLAYEYLPTTIRSRPEKGINLESSLSTGSARSGESKNTVILRAQIFFFTFLAEDFGFIVHNYNLFDAVINIIFYSLKLNIYINIL